MSKISKDKAEAIAKKLTEKCEQYKEQVKKEYEDLVESIYNAQVPDKVKQVYDVYPEYFEVSESIYIDGPGLHQEHVYVNKEVISNYSGSYAMLKVDAKTATIIVKEKRRMERAETNYKKLFTDTKNALLALGTAKRIREHLPEAVQYLPVEVSQSLVTNFDSLRKMLEKQGELLAQSK